MPLIFIQDKTDPETFEPKRLVVDGQQRLRTVLAYVDAKCLPDLNESDQFSILRMHNADIAGVPFNRLAEDLRHRVLQFEFSVHVLPSTTPNKLILETFARMNATGTRLNEQEVRNAEFSGAFKQLAYHLAYGELERWLRWELFAKAQIARMKDVELTSELIIFLLIGFSGKSQATIRNHYRDYDDEVPNERALTRRFVHILDRLDEVYSEELNRIFQEDFEDSPFNSQSWFYPLYAFVHDLSYSESLAGSPAERPRPLDTKALRQHLMGCTRSLQSDDLDRKVLKALRGASTDKASRETRYEFLRQGWRSGKR